MRKPERHEQKDTPIGPDCDPLFTMEFPGTSQGETTHETTKPSLAILFVDGVVEIEEYGKRDGLVPLAPWYRVRVNDEKHTFEHHFWTPRAVLEQLNYTPPENYLLTLDDGSGAEKVFELDQKFSFMRRGLEKLNVYYTGEEDGD